MLIERKVLKESQLSGLQLVNQGKVRDIYDLGETLLLVASDRISAFDVVLPEGIPGKGAVLTALSSYWFAWLESLDGMPKHHLLSTKFKDFPEACRPHRDVLEGRSMVVQKARPLPVECIVRGYLAGSGWKDYQRTGSISGVSLPLGLRQADPLPEVIFTPSTKASDGEHDMNITFKQMCSELGDELAGKVRAASLSIYGAASRMAKKQGIIIADTKMEFGLDESTGELLLIDELLTPDSSRFWPASSYSPGSAQPSFDK
jgi:phosphoribosylaminoimidazole-succinocarboxamide synthase